MGGGGGADCKVYKTACELEARERRSGRDGAFGIMDAFREGIDLWLLYANLLLNLL